MKPIPEATCRTIIQQAKDGMSSRQIGSLHNIHHSTVNRIIKKQPEPIISPRAGRPRIFSIRAERRLVRKVTSGVCPTAADAQRQLQTEEQLNVSVSTVKRVLRRNGLHGRVRKKKPLLSKKYRQQRYAFALRYRKSKPEFWKRVIWYSLQRNMVVVLSQFGDV